MGNSVVLPPIVVDHVPGAFPLVVPLDSAAQLMAELAELAALVTVAGRVAHWRVPRFEVYDSPQSGLVARLAPERLSRPRDPHDAQKSWSEYEHWYEAPAPRRVWPSTNRTPPPRAPRARPCTRQRSNAQARQLCGERVRAHRTR